MITFDKYLQMFDNGTLVQVTTDERAKPNSRLHIVKVKSASEEKSLADKLDFFLMSAMLIEQYPQCREMIVDAVHRYEKTGEKFQVCHNLIEDKDVQKDVMPITVYFPEI